MSSVSIIIGIIVLLFGLVCYALSYQTIQNKREQKKRLLTALKAQSRGFKFILSGCPEGFLNKELVILVLRSLIEVSEQLTKLEPKDSTCLQDLKLYTDKLTETQRQTPSTARIPIQNPQQIKEVKMCLEELHRFIHRLETQTQINKSQSDGHRNQIKQLVLQVTVDGYALNGQTARQAGKTKLALHYYDLAYKLLLRDGKTGVFESTIARYKALVEELTQQLETEEPEAINAPTDAVDAEMQAELDEAWDKFSSADEGVWKKKQIYD